MLAFCYAAHSSITDHDGVIFFLHSKSLKMPSHKTIKIINYHTLDSGINNLEFDQLYILQNVNQATRYFIKSMNRLVVTNSLKTYQNVKEP